MIGARHRDSGARTAERPNIAGRLLHGHFADFVRDRHAFMLNAHAHAARRGDVIRLRIGRRPLYLFNSPETIEEVLVTRSAELERRIPIGIGSRFIGNSPFLSRGAQWRHQRSLLGPLFGKARVDGYAPVVVDCANETMTAWRTGDVLDAHREMSRAALAVAGRVFCSTDLLGSAEVLYGSTRTGAENFVDLLNRSLVPAFAPTPANLRARAARKRMDALLYDLIARRRASARSCPGPDDALSLLLQAHDVHGRPLSDRAIRDELFLLIFGGHETTALALAWLLHVCANHPDEQERVAEEVRSALRGALPTAADRERLPSLRQAILESMRVFPPFWGSWREAVEDCEVAGVPIERGSWVMVSQWLAHHDPRHYDDPHAVCPARWSDAGRVTPRGPDYFPFGLGPRSCIATGFAMSEITLITAAVIQRFRFRPAPGEPVRMHPSFTLRPKHGIPLVVERREQ